MSTKVEEQLRKAAIMFVQTGAYLDLFIREFESSRRFPQVL